MHAHCYLNMSSGSSVSHHEQLGYSTTQTSDVWLVSDSDSTVQRLDGPLDGPFLMIDILR